MLLKFESNSILISKGQNIWLQIPYARHYKPRLVYFFVFKEVFSENSVLMYGLYSRAASNQERLMMARVRYIMLHNKCTLDFGVSSFNLNHVKLELHQFLAAGRRFASSRNQ